VPFARLRTVDGRHLFTVERPAENVLSCEEHETVIADRAQMHRAIVAMGFSPTVRIRKVRRCACTPTTRSREHPKRQPEQSWPAGDANLDLVAGGGLAGCSLRAWA